MSNYLMFWKGGLVQGTQFFFNPSQTSFSFMCRLVCLPPSTFVVWSASWQNQEGLMQFIGPNILLWFMTTQNQSLWHSSAYEVICLNHTWRQVLISFVSKDWVYVTRTVLLLSIKVLTGINQFSLKKLYFTITGSGHHGFCSY